MKSRTIFLLAVVAALVLAGCGGKTELPAYVGTWVNSTYNGNGGLPPGKVVMTSNEMNLYNNDTDPTPVLTGSISVVEDWTSGADHYFKGTATQSGGGGTGYFLMCVSNNNTLQITMSDTGYPTDLTDAATFTRQ